MNVKKFATNDVRARKKEKYSIVNLSPSEFETIYKALNASNDPAAVKMGAMFEDLATNDANVEIDASTFEELENALKAFDVSTNN